MVYPKSQIDVLYIKSSLHQSFKVWGDQINNIEFQESNSLDADIMISFGRWEHGDGSGFDGKGGIYGNF